MPRYIYKLLRDDEWQAAKDAPAFAGAPVDHADGFIHFSTADQVAETARLHFAGVNPLHLLAVDPWQLPVGQLKWEASRGGQEFPHLYGPLPMSAVVRAMELTLDADGTADFSLLEELERDD